MPKPAVPCSGGALPAGWGEGQQQPLLSPGLPDLTPRREARAGARRGRQLPAWFLLNTAWREDFWVLFKERSVCEDPSPLQVSRLGILDEFLVTRKPGTQSKPHLPDLAPCQAVKTLSLGAGQGRLVLILQLSVGTSGPGRGGPEWPSVKLRGLAPQKCD